MTITFIDGFETAGAFPWEAAGWTVTQLASIEEYAAFQAGAINVAYEGFEASWDNDDFILEFEPADIEVARFLPFNRTVEDFEHSWSDNQNWQDELISTSAAVFHTTEIPVENFEREWLSNEDWEDELTSIEAVQFHSTLAAAEDFEREWRSNEDYKFSMTIGAPDTEAAQFDTALDPYEDFETEWPTMVMQTI